jgi:SAM-dependent methyltransferase
VTPADADQVIAYYATGGERDRLTHGEGLLEAARTWSVLDDHLPRPPAAVLDVGGGAGAYALPLAERGYAVSLVDLSPLHVEQARAAGLRAAEVGDARDLRQAAASADVVLLLGPLYHLPEAADRSRALQEARRVLRPGGLLVAAAICRFASLLDGLARRLLDDPVFAGIVEEDLTSGRHVNPDPALLPYFTTAYLHRPDELRNEIACAGFDVLRLVGVEGPGWLLPDVGERMRHPEGRRQLLETARRVESEPSLIGASAHLLAIARPDGRG